MARLGGGLSSTGKLREESMRLAIETIGKMKAIADGFGAEIRAIATSAVREAANGQMLMCDGARRAWQIDEGMGGNGRKPKTQWSRVSGEKERLRGRIS